MIAEAVEIIRTSPRYGYDYGVHASFKRINHKWGLKFFYNEGIRNKTYELQNMAAAIGCAPILGEKFELTDPDGDTIYGYITECIEKNLSDTIDEDEDEDGYWTLPEYENLMEKLSTILDPIDIHDDNVGYMTDGRLVCIDFSNCEYLPTEIDDADV
jgi:hypothetical protein